MINKIEKTRQEILKKGQKIINLSSGNPGEFGIFFPEKILQNAYGKFLKNPAYHPEPKGDLKARKAIAGFYAKRNFNVNPDQILLTSGTSESYFEVFKLLNPHDAISESSGHACTNSIPCAPATRCEILLPNPSYPLFEEIARLAEVDFSFYRLDEKAGWQIDLNDLRAKIRPETRAIVLISPSNPTGAVLSEKTLKEVIKIAVENNLAIISDEVFSEFMFDQKVFPRVAQIHQKMADKSEKASKANSALTKKNIQNSFEKIQNLRIFTLSGISKTYALPGLKLGWIVVTGSQNQSHHGPNNNTHFSETVNELERLADTFLACNQLTQTMLPDIISKGESFIKKYRNHLQKNRDLAMKILGGCPKITFHKSEGGMYLFVRIDGLFKTERTAHGPRKRPVTDEEFVIKLLEKHKIFVHPGYFYDYDNGLYLLISFLIPKKELEKSLKRIIAIL
ncbi:MAG: pyridoxal phosphate-dependent aminotransferase [Candidatus Gracilibacteria bacterium]|jgi:hypothetical protein